MNTPDEVSSPRYRRASWMSDLRPHIGAFPITEIRIPGTHDTATYNIKKQSPFGAAAPGLLGKQSNPVASVVRFFAKPTASKWSRCHSMTILEQLKFGIRYMDWRLTPHPEDEAHRLWSEHGQLSVSLQTMVAELLLFLNSEASRNEFIIIDIQHVNGVSDDDLPAVLFDALGAIADRCIPNSTPLNTPLNELWDANPQQRIFLFVGRKFDAARFPFAYVRSGHLKSSWKNKPLPAELVDALDKDLREGKEGAASEPGKFATCVCVSQCVSSPNTAQIAKSVFTVEALSQEENMKQLAQQTNSPVLQWFYRWNGRNELQDGSTKKPVNNTHRNVVMIDYPEMGRVRVHWDGHEREMDVVHTCCFINSLLAAGGGDEQ